MRLPIHTPLAGTLACLLAGTLAGSLAGSLCGQAGEYLSKTEALALAFPQAVRATEWARPFAKGEKKVLQKRLVRTLSDRGYYVYLLEDGDGPCGLAVITAEIGRTENFTFLVGLDLQRRVSGLHVMKYGEPRGGEVRRRSFLDQFIGSGVDRRFRLHREIENIPGATLSAVAVTRGVRKVLAISDVWFRGMSDEQLQAQFNKHGKRLELPNRVGTTHRENFPAMGTVCSLVLEGVSSERAAKISKQVRAAMRATEERLSNWSADSELSRALEAGASEHPVRLSPELFADLARAMAAAEECGGAFDPTIYAALKRPRSGHGCQGQSLRSCVGHDKVSLDEKQQTLRFACRGMGISTDAFAKGLAVDRAVKILRAHGVRRGRVGFRSTFYLLGKGHHVPMPNGEVLTLGDCAVGAAAAVRRAEPILDPRTLSPVTFTGTAVVVAEDGFSADWLATAATVLGPERGREALRKSGRRICFSPTAENP